MSDLSLFSDKFTSKLEDEDIISGTHEIAFQDYINKIIKNISESPSAEVGSFSKKQGYNTPLNKKSTDKLENSEKDIDYASDITKYLTEKSPETVEKTSKTAEKTSETA